MAQYNAGSLSILDGGTTATGVGTQFLGNVESGDYLLVFNQFNQSVHVATVTAVGSDTDVTFSPAYSGADLSGVTYAMTTDFTALKNLALMYPGDLGASDLFNRNMQTIEQALIDMEQTVNQEAVKHSGASQVEFESRRAINNEMFAASGMVHFGKQFGDEPSTFYVNEGIWCKDDNVAYTNACMMGWDTTTTVLGESKTAYPVVNIAGVITGIKKIANSLWGGSESFIKFPQAPDGTVTYDSATGAIVQHADSATAFAAETATNKVVTEREDMFGLEGYLEEVSVANPYVYPNGNIQSQATTMNGIATGASNRPDSYYAVFDGDTTSKGKGVNFWMSSESAQKAMLSDPSNNLYYLDDGRLVQWRIRQRTVAGAGNGTWGFLGTEGSTYLGFDNYAYPLAQGSKDSVASMADGSTAGEYYAGKDIAESEHYRGVFSAKGLNGGDINTVAVNGECYFLVLGAVSRLNQGAYHPSFNSAGAARGINSSGSSSVFWYSGDLRELTSKADCFNYHTDTVYPYDDGKVYPHSGSITRAGGLISGRPDGRAYDAIYADGQGGVDDLRLSAWGITREEALGEKDARYKNGEERGLQELVFSVPTVFTQVTSNAVSNGVQLTNGTVASSGVKVGDTVSVSDASGNVLAANAVITLIDTSPPSYETLVWDAARDGTFNRVAGNDYYSLLSVGTNTQVSGEFLQTDVIGDPANILATPDLANGWLGGWVPVIPVSSTTYVLDLTRKSLVSTGTRYTTNDNGLTWASTSQGYDTVQNTGSVFLSSGSIAIFEYTAHAYLTEAADNAVVYQGSEGIGDVFVTSYYDATTNYGAFIAESCSSTILTNNSSGVTVEELVLEKFLVRNTGVLNPVAKNALQHRHTTLAQPTNNSHAVKALSTLTEINGQLFIDYKGKEMVWDTTLDNGAEFTDINMATIMNSTPVGTYVHMTDGDFRGWYLTTNLWSSTSYQTQYDAGNITLDIDGNLMATNGLIILTKWNGNGWGDDNLIDIVDGVTTGTDLNGNTVTKFNQRGVKPLGWVKNVA